MKIENYSDPLVYWFHHKTHISQKIGFSWWNHTTFSVQNATKIIHFIVTAKIPMGIRSISARGAAFSFILSFFFNFVRIFARIDYFVDLLAVLFPRNSDFLHILFWRNPSVFIPVFFCKLKWLLVYIHNIRILN